MTPSKLDLLAAWLPGQTWFDGTVDGLTQVAAYRFDDPAGRVGVETLLVRAGDGPVHQAPLTYRDAPLAGAEQWLAGTMKHSVLGDRWVYDGCADPVYAATLAAGILAGLPQADLIIDTGGGTVRRPFTMTIVGTGQSTAPDITGIRRVIDGDPTRIETDPLTLNVARVLGTPPAACTHTLTATWEGQPTPVVLAYV